MNSTAQPPLVGPASVAAGERIGSEGGTRTAEKRAAELQTGMPDLARVRLEGFLAASEKGHAIGHGYRGAGHLRSRASSILAVMTRSRLLVVVVLAATIGATSAIAIRGGQDGRAATGIGETEGQLVTLLDYLESGRRLARDYLAKQPAPGGATLWDVARACGPACVRVEVEVARQGAAVAAIHGSGVIVAGGRYVLTAGHALDTDKVLAIRVILNDGRALAATAVKKDYEVFNSTGRDWAVLKLGDDRPDDLVSLKLGDAEKGAPVIALGYPDQIGTDEDGRIAYSRDAPLAPLLFPAHVTETAPLALSPAAGAVPLGGISGGPVINAAGEVVGIFVSVSKTRTSNLMVVSYGATPVAAFKDALAED